MSNDDPVNEKQISKRHKRFAPVVGATNDDDVHAAEQSIVARTGVNLVAFGLVHHFKGVCFTKYFENLKKNEEDDSFDKNTIRYSTTTNNRHQQSMMAANKNNNKSEPNFLTPLNNPLSPSRSSGDAMMSELMAAEM